MAERKKSGGKGFQTVRKDIREQTIHPFYVLYGEESYLRDRTLEQLREALLSGGFAEFNFHRVAGRDLKAEQIIELTEAMPMMGERTLVELWDYDLMNGTRAEREKMAELLADLSPWCCLVFVYDTISFSLNARPGSAKEDGKDTSRSTLRKLLRDNDRLIELSAADEADLSDWVVRQFAQRKKKIDRAAAEHLIFTSGNLMAALIPEIEKLAHCSERPEITKKEIDTIASPILATQAFRIADAVVQGEREQAAVILGELLRMREEPGKILNMLALQLRKLYAARLALDYGLGASYLKDQWEIKDYPAKLLMGAAKRTTLTWCEEALKLCQTLDRRFKSENGIDEIGELKLLLVRLEVT